MEIRKRMKSRLLTLLITVLMVAAISSCSDSTEIDNNGMTTARMQVALVDDPAEYDAILIDVQGVEYRIDTDSTEEGENEGEEDGEENSEEESDNDGEWNTLEVTPTVYDLLKLNNGEEAILADEDIEAGELEQVRLILGNNNKIVIDGDTSDIFVPSGSQTGLKINIDGEVEDNKFYRLVLDFDAAQSVVELGNGEHILKPVVRATLTEVDEEDVFGSISGVVMPDTVSTVVYVLDINDEDTISTTMPEDDGAFLIDLLPEETYNVYAVPEEGSEFTTASEMNVVVIAGEETELDTLNLGGE
ncbi:DUF4382 domain-containing protein [Ekhidna sp.]|uniref:DUF4382 domain-containing protein n=1 Tax=Ekhidna sp. TaxID=2608089 RepID=UPI003B595929